jgi:hypothetical protein
VADQRLEAFACRSQVVKLVYSRRA